MSTDAEPQVTKRRVTMRSIFATPEGTGTQEAVDYVRPDFLDAYVADAQTRWQVVEVSDEPDAGPGGYEGSTYVPPNLDVPNAGEFYPATGDRAEEEQAAPVETESQEG